MGVCLRCRSLLTRAVRWPSHSSKRRVPLTTFIAPDDSGLRIEKSNAETRRFIAVCRASPGRASLDGQVEGDCPHLMILLILLRLKLCSQEPSVAALGHFPSHKPYCFQFDTAWPAACPC